MKRGSTSRDGKLAHHIPSRLMVTLVESIRDAVHISTNVNRAEKIVFYLNQLFLFIVCFSSLSSLPLCVISTLVVRILMLTTLDQSNYKTH